MLTKALIMPVLGIVRGLQRKKPFELV